MLDQYTCKDFFYIIGLEFQKKLDIIRSSMKIVENHGYNSKTKKILLTINAVKQSNIFDGMIISCNFKKRIKTVFRSL